MKLLLLALALAAEPLDAEKEARARALDQEIRCVRCVNEPISQSTSDIAADMRSLVRERIAAGDSDAEIRTYFSDRYGDEVLFRPPIKPETWLLWLSPLLILGLGAAAVATIFRQSAAVPPSGDVEPETDER